MNAIQTILIAFVILTLIYYLIKWFTTESKKLSKTEKGTTTTTIPSNKLKNNNIGNFTYSVWFNVSDWNYNYGEEKTLFVVQSKDTSSAVPLEVKMGNTENNIDINVRCYGDNNNDISHKCSITNFPLQKWVCLIISVYGRTLDVYLDGKLTQTCVLPGPSNMQKLSKVVVTPKNKGFQGLTSDLTYYSKSCNPQEAYNIYKSGFGSSSFSGLVNKYKLKISFLENDEEKWHMDI